jgi:hypothetical protein
MIEVHGMSGRFLIAVLALMLLPFMASAQDYPTSPQR